MGATLNSTMIKGALFLLGTVATLAAAAGTYETELLRGIDIYNFRSKCWGKQNVDEDDFYEYLQQVNDHKHFKHNAMGNLTCVLQKTGQLTEDMEINMDWYAAALRAEEPETGFTWNAEGAAATDPEWREKIATAYEDCHELAESWPATSLNRRPMTRMFGRQMIFFKCADRTERRVCTEA